MIPMLVDRPLREKNVSLLRFQQSAEFFVLRIIDNRAAIDLPSEDRSGMKDFTGCVGFSGSDGAALTWIPAFAKALPSIEIEQNNIMT